MLQPTEEKKTQKILPSTLQEIVLKLITHIFFSSN